MAVGLELKLKKFAFRKKVKAKVALNLARLGREIVDDLEKQVSTPFPPASRVGESPHKRSGDLKGSFKFIIKESFFSVGMRIFTEIPYALRLEFGFVGTDSRGRNINQGPRPYWRPVLSRSRIGPGIARR